jgi:hypothetical protein
MPLSQPQFATIATFIKTHARLVDRALFSFLFENGPAEAVLNELTKYQNDDGGFGHGLEPDFVTPSSSAIATTVALQYMIKVCDSSTNELVSRALSWFCNNFNKEEGRWRAVPADVNDFPHAPWWHVDETTGMCLIDNAWENPTVEITGYLHAYPNAFPPSIRDELTTKAVRNLKEITDIYEHSLYCYLRFYDHVDDKMKERIQPLLSKRIRNTVNRNPADWQTQYVPKPLDFVKSPKSPFYPQLKDLVDQNLDVLIETVQTKEAWEPTWQWGQYEEAWEKAKKDWTGTIAVKNLCLLREFGRVKG